MKLKKGVKDLVAEAEAGIEALSVGEAIKAHDDGNHIFVDVRDIRELERDGMIPNARHAPRGVIEFWFDPESPYHRSVFADENKTYVLYCRSAWRSALAAKQLVDMGFTNVKHFAKGFDGWLEAGGAVQEKNKKA